MKPPRTALKRFALAAVLAAGLSMVARAQPVPGFEPPGGMMPPPGRPDMAPGFGELPMRPFLHGLKLSEPQQDKLFAIFHAHAPQMREQAKAAKAANDALHELALSEQYDEARAGALAEASGKAAAEMALLRARIDHEIVALLTPEQRQSANGKNFR